MVLFIHSVYISTTATDSVSVIVFPCICLFSFTERQCYINTQYQGIQIMGMCLSGVRRKEKKIQLSEVVKYDPQIENNTNKIRS